ncbi:MAG: hypothetical protein HQL32_06740 [Planctomycetes bacterium]|nr:hypothetical protein [Planctomycetota bacterium]
MKHLVILLFLFLYSAFLFAATPMNQEVPEQKITEIECEYKKNEPGIAKIFAIKPIQGVYHYKVLLPRGYYENESLRYPCLFVASPGGNAKLGKMEEYIKENGWIAVLLVESRNKSKQGEMMASFLAAHDDAIERFRIQEGLKFTTGMSGGARCSSYNAGMRPGFAGILLQAAGFGYNFAKGSGTVYHAVTAFPHMCVFLTMGRKDSNKVENGRLEKVFAKLPNPFHIEPFDGGHTWAPKQTVEKGLAWLEKNAFEQTKEKGVFCYYHKKYMDEIKDSENDLTYPQYLQIVNMKKMADKFKLKYKKDFKENYATLSSLYYEAKKSKHIKKEILCAKLLASLQAKEKKLVTYIESKKMSTKSIQSQAKKVISSYQKFIDKYPESYFASDAEESIKSLNSL